jgi:eukaryotic-like serine/threonine-protein kinase
MRDPLLGQSLGSYQIIAQLGQGGVARVYRAIQQPLGREVALKIVRPDLDEAHRAEFEERFLREAAMAGRLSHANVVTVFDFGRSDEGVCYIAMELLRGTPLRAWMTGDGMTQDEVARIGAGLARGLRHAHQRGLVHRDVKPGNIFLVRDDDGIWQPQLLDFGLVKDPSEESITGVGTFLGTPHYIAPEQAKGNAVDSKADVYSLGIVLYRMLTGRLPFEAENPMAIALKHLREQPPTFAERAPDAQIDASLERIVFECLEKDPLKRIDSHTLAQRLDNWREGSISTLQPLPVPPPKGSKVGVVMAALMGIGLVMVTVAAVAWKALDVTVEEPAAQVDVEPEIEPEPEVEVEPEPEIEVEVEPEPEPEPEPLVVPVNTPVVVAPVAVKPPPKPAQPVTPPSSVIIDDVQLTGPQAAALLNWVNTADEETLRSAGIYTRGVNIIVEKRPFADIHAFADTPYIGRKTIESALAALP